MEEGLFCPYICRGAIHRAHHVCPVSFIPGNQQGKGLVRHQRRSIRLRHYDYSQAGAYFVTICTRDRQCLFGEVVENEMRLNQSGKTVARVWHSLPERFPEIELDAFVVMPNHFHGILMIPYRLSHQDYSGRNELRPYARKDEPEAASSAGNPHLGELVRILKAVSTRQIRQMGYGLFAWQRNYFEHIIRDEKSLASIREYILLNPLKWALDRENPVNL